MKIVVEFSDIDHRRELSITDGTVTINTKNGFMMREEDLHNWITRTFYIWLKLKENQRGEEVDTEPIRHGHWIEVSPQESYKCSVCSLITDWEDIYCPNCGTKMDEVEE